jgi:hypothetical protein
MGVTPNRYGVKPNLMRMTFLRGEAPSGFGDNPIRTLGDPEQDRADLVADLRAATGRYPRDPRLASLIQDLMQSDEFSRVWNRGAVARHESVRKLVSHPLGDITLDCDSMTVPGADLHILVYTAAEGSTEADRLEFLTVTRPSSVADLP